MDDGYETGAFVTGVIVFLVVWVASGASYGFLGFALGWMPALILAGIAGVVWPFIAFVALALVAWLLAVA